MPPKTWPYLKAYKAKNGAEYLYFRPTNERLPGPIGSPEFRKAYSAALAAHESGRSNEPDKPTARTFAALIADYKASTDYARLAAASQRAYNHQITWLLSECGAFTVAGMKRGHVNILLAKRARVGAGTYNIFLAVLRVLINHAIRIDWRKDDPTLKIRSMPMDEHRTWEPKELDAYRARWAIGTRERLAFDLGLYTGQRIGDCAKMTWADVDLIGGTIKVTQEKTGTKLQIPIHASLMESIAAVNRRGIAVIAKEDGARITTGSFRTMFRLANRAAGLPTDCRFHGLRKTAAAHLAEVGCTVHEIAAVTGHKSLSEIERYTRGVKQLDLARAAMARRTV